MFVIFAAAIYNKTNKTIRLVAFIVGLLSGLIDIGLSYAFWMVMLVLSPAPNVHVA